MICYSFPPPAPRKGPIGIWDEFVCGTANKLGWLGKPEGDAVHLAAATPNCLGGMDAWAKRISAGATARTADGKLVISSTGPADQGLSFSIHDVPVTGEDITVFVTMKGAPRNGYPVEMARFAEIGVTSGVMCRPDVTGMALRCSGELPIAPGSGARVNYRASEKIGDKAIPAYAIHPPFQSGKGYVFWCSDVDVPPNAELRFHLGMAEKSPQRSDGVWFSVLVAPLAGATPGTFSRVFEESTKAHQWLPRSVSLAKWAGQRIRLKFVADCGPKDNTVTDQGFWGDVKIARAGVAEDALTKPKSHMTWVNDRFFTSAFYFRDVRSQHLDLTFRIEGNEPVTIQRITAHAHPDAMYRIFENGLVLANPSHAPYTFDLAKLSPGRTYRRMQATPLQDTAANNGENVGAQLTLGPLEGLFLKRDRGAK
ncbi:MAG: hypothetical protein FJ395_13490 [Verrucomicrobia bacterium]|nr:hypothetical protein [Verrucomicrobiota bacterium]